jgi:hypothetical protein
MKRLAIAIGLMALGFAAATPARADFAVVKFDKSGWCRIWRDTALAPPDGHFLWWHARWPHPHWYYRLPTWADAELKLHKAVAWHRCRAGVW